MFKAFLIWLFYTDRLILHQHDYYASTDRYGNDRHSHKPTVFNHNCELQCCRHNPTYAEEHREPDM